MEIYIVKLANIFLKPKKIAIHMKKPAKIVYIVKL